jgi:hypothetical protein
MVGGKKRQQHIVVAEKALGKSLPAGAIVHHVDHNGQNNAPTNLVICPDQTYHKLIHLRERALDESGDPDKRKCIHCQQYDAQRNLSSTGAGKRSGQRFYHKACRAAAVANQKKRRRENESA